MYGDFSPVGIVDIADAFAADVARREDKIRKVVVIHDRRDSAPVGIRDAAVDEVADSTGRHQVPRVVVVARERRS